MFYPRGCVAFSSRTNSPACLLGLFPSRAASLARAIVCLSGLNSSFLSRMLEYVYKRGQSAELS